MIEPNIVLMEYGSRLYGTATPESDTDYAGIRMPTFRDLILNKGLKTKQESTGDDKSKNGKDDVDTVVYTLDSFVRDGIRGDTTVLDMLHCPHPITGSWVWNDLVKNRKKFYSQNMKAYIGYVKSQAMKYGLKGDKLAELKVAIEFLSGNIIKRDMKIASEEIWSGLPEGAYLKKIIVQGEDIYYEVLGKKYSGTNTLGYVLKQLGRTWDSYGHRAKCAMENDGMDWKALHHALRVGYQIEHMAMYGDWEYPLPETEFLMRVKRGGASYKEEIAPELDRILESVPEMLKSSGLPEEVDVDFWEKWLIGVYDEWFNITYKES